MIPKWRAKVTCSSCYGVEEGGWVTTDTVCKCLKQSGQAGTKKEYTQIRAIEHFFHALQYGELDPDTLGMATGLKDKNGKEMYKLVNLL